MRLLAFRWRGKGCGSGGKLVAQRGIDDGASCLKDCVKRSDTRTQS